MKQPPLTASTPSRPRKIIRLISRLNVGGPVIHVTLLTRHFQSSDWQSLLVTGTHGANEGDMSYLTAQYGVKPLIMPDLGREISPLKDLRILISLLRLLRRERPDIVHTHTAKAGTLGRLAALLTRVPRVYHTFHGHVFSGYFSPLKTRLFIGIERFLARHSTAIIAISERQKQDLIGYHIAPADKIRIIPLGFDFSRVLPPDPERRLRWDLGIDPGVTTIALVGRLTAIKHPLLFIQMAQSLLKLRQDVHFLVIGDGELRESCEREVQARGLAAKFSFTGFMADLKLIYGSADIVCLTSINEGTPVSLIEAMACRKLVFATAVGGVGDLIRSGENGFICKADPAAFAEAIARCLEQPDKYSELGEQGSRDILAKYGSERLFRDLEQLYGQDL